MFWRVTLGIVASIVMGTPEASAEPSLAEYAVVRSNEQSREASALADAVGDLCDRQIVMIGENGFHGDGRTAAFKSDLVQQLVNRCGFNVVMFESGRYDFVAIQRQARRGEPVTHDMVKAAIGGIWNQNAEIQPLIDFLRDEVNARRITLAGLDDQLGSRGSFYSLEAMPVEMAGYLESDRRETCGRELKRRIWSAYSSAEPYTEAVRSDLLQCLAEVEAALPIEAAADRADMLTLVANYRRALARDFTPPADRLPARDASMFQNLEAMTASAGGAAPKVIVWAANGHIAREPVPGGPFAGSRNFGAHVHERYGARAYALGFSAAEGSFRFDASKSRDIAPAAEGSLEARALIHAEKEADAAFRPSSWLQLQGRLPGSAFDDHQPVTANWDRHYDGVVVFRAERRPYRLDEL